MNSQYIIHNGELHRSDDALFNHFNRAFAYGDGVFETMHAYGTDVQLLHRHFDRLSDALSVLKMIPHKQLTPQNLEKEIQRLLNRNKHYAGARIRLTVFRNNGGKYTPETNDSSYIVETSALEYPKYEVNPKGLIVDVCNRLKKPINILSPYKTINSLLYVLAGIYASENGLSEALIVNENGQIIESQSSNLFVIKNNELLTPPVEQGCVDGVMRSVVIEIARKTGMYIDEKQSFTEELLLSADEIFLTNAVTGIRWVVAFRSRRYFNQTIKLLVDQLNEHLF